MSWCVVMDIDHFAYPKFKSYGANMVQPYRFNKTKITRKFRKWVSVLLNKEYLFINDELEKFDNYLMFDDVGITVVKYIRRINPNARIVVYYANPEKYSCKISDYKKLNCEIWSFDEEDVSANSISWNPLPFFGNEDVTHATNNRKYDVYFIGKDKGRYNQIIKYRNIFENKGLTTNFLIVPNTNFPFYDKKKYHKQVKYEQNIKNVYSAKSILDIMQSNQYGFTMRILEGLFTRTKVITSNKSIKKYDFYCKENFFVLEDDDIENIYKFVNTPWNHEKDICISFYSFSSWLERMDIRIEKLQNIFL